MREIKFKGKAVLTGEWVYGYYIKHGDNHFIYNIKKNSKIDMCGVQIDPKTLGQFAELRNSEKTEIYGGDIVELRLPYRSEQTHSGPNIPGPTGEYVEPLEPEINIIKTPVVFYQGQWITEYDKNRRDLDWFEDDFYKTPLSFRLNQSYQNRLKEAFEIDDREPWDDKEEGNLQYILEQYNLKSEKELIEYLEAVPVLGSIHDNQELLKETK